MQTAQVSIPATTKQYLQLASVQAVVEQDFPSAAGFLAPSQTVQTPASSYIQLAIVLLVQEIGEAKLYPQAHPIQTLFAA